MVNVGFDHEFVAQVLPQVEVHSVIVCLGDWSCGRHRDITSCRPVWTRRDGVRGISKKPADEILFQMKCDQLPVAKKLLRALIIKETAKGAYYQHFAAPAHVCSCLCLCASGNESSVRAYSGSQELKVRRGGIKRGISDSFCARWVARLVKEIRRISLPDSRFAKYPQLGHFLLFNRDLTNVRR